MKGIEKSEKLEKTRRQTTDDDDRKTALLPSDDETDGRAGCLQCEEELLALRQQEATRMYYDRSMDDDDVFFPDDEEAGLPKGDSKFQEGIPMRPVDKRNRVVYTECEVMDWAAHKDNIPFSPEEGAELLLIRNVQHDDDPYAVAVALADYYDGNTNEVVDEDIIGYLPRESSQMVAQLMDMGWKDVFSAVLTSVIEKEKAGHRFEQLRMTLYIDHKEKTEEVEDPGKALFAMMVDLDGLRRMKKELTDRGCVCYRWGGFESGLGLPEVGNKVLVVYKTDEEATLYLMRMMAKDMQSMPFLEQPEEVLYSEDDCVPYVLTNIAGPKKVPLEDVADLDLDNNCGGEPEGRLAAWAAEQVLALFEDEVN